MPQISHTAVNKLLHPVEQQLCRWLLINADLLQTNKLIMTHDLIANMLGVRRDAVNKSAVKLQHRRMIDYCRSHFRSSTEPRSKPSAAAATGSSRKATTLSDPDSSALTPVHWRFTKGRLFFSSRISNKFFNYFVHARRIAVISGFLISRKTFSLPFLKKRISYLRARIARRIVLSIL